jgi:hypothetical protein
MSRPIPVVVHRPHLSTREAGYRVLVELASTALIAWFLMLLIPLAVPDWHPGYWQALAGLVVVRFVQKGSGVGHWTKSGQGDDEEADSLAGVVR